MLCSFQLVTLKDVIQNDRTPTRQHQQEWQNSDAREHCLECYTINSTGYTQKRYLEKQGRETEKFGVTGN